MWCCGIECLRITVSIDEGDEALLCLKEDVMQIFNHLKGRQALKPSEPEQLAASLAKARPVGAAT